MLATVTGKGKNILVILFVLVVVYHLLFKNKLVEGYHYYRTTYCGRCGYNTRYRCSRCTNCGYCITGKGHGECVPGDHVGPYFRNDCASWEYGYPHDMYYPYTYTYPRSKYYPTGSHFRYVPSKFARWRAFRTKARDASRHYKRGYSVK